MLSQEVTYTLDIERAVLEVGAGLFEVFMLFILVYLLFRQLHTFG